jgi:3'-phosphoadenosine 5'-phosphosulfate (PAPS) 3'-phosphatase
VVLRGIIMVLLLAWCLTAQAPLRVGRTAISLNEATSEEVSLTELLSTCIDAAQRGCAEIRRVQTLLVRDGNSGGSTGMSVDQLQLGQVDDKIDNDPRSALTAADLAAQAVIIEALSKAWPGLVIVGEEDASCDVYDTRGAVLEVCESDLIGADAGSELRRDLCSSLVVSSNSPNRAAALADITVFVDPLDGTREFVEGRICNVQTLIGIAVRGEAVAGAVGLPFVNLGGGSDADGPADSEAAAVVYALVGGGPPRVHGRQPGDADRSDPVHGGGVPSENDRPLLVTGDASDGVLAATYAEALAGGGKRLTLGGTGQKCLAVAEGRADVAIMNFKSSSWDTCAPEALVRAAGGEVTDLFGQRLLYRSNPPSAIGRQPAGGDPSRAYINACGVIASSAQYSRTHSAVCAATRRNVQALRALEAWGLPAGTTDEAVVERVLENRRRHVLGS